MAADMIISGFVGKAIDLAVDEIIRYIHMALRCQEELRSLKTVVQRTQRISKGIQQYRVDLRFPPLQTPGNALPAEPSAVNEWLEELNTHLQNARDMVEHCTIPTYNVLFRYQLSKKITRVIADIEKHLKDTSLVAFLDQCENQVYQAQTLRRIEENQVGQAETLRRIEDQLREAPAAIASSSSSSSPALDATASVISAQRRQALHEPFIVGQDEIFSAAEGMLIDQSPSRSRVGVVGMGGSGKTLLLKRLFNSDPVQRHFQDALMLWLTVSQCPSDARLLKELGNGISTSFEQLNLSGKRAQRWCHEQLSQRKFVLFFDDVWQGGEGLLETLGVPVPEDCHHSSKIIVSTREKSVLAKMRVTNSNTITIDFLSEDHSWELFCFHAFPENPKSPPVGVIAERAMSVCSECGRLPLAIKVIGSAMAGVADSSRWEVALEKLQNADRLNSTVQQRLYDRLKLSYDALGKDHDPSLQLCFLYLGAFREDQNILVTHLIELWIGDGLVGTENDDAFAKGQEHVNLLLDRCLIQAPVYDTDAGHLIEFSVHDMLHDLARQIAEKEENCLFRAGEHWELFPTDECSIRGSTRISLMDNDLSSIPDTFRGPKVQALLLRRNRMLNKMPRRMMESLTSVRILDLHGCSNLQSLPESLGCTKRLVCLNLNFTGIRKLPESITCLKKLRVLHLVGSELREWPREISKLTSLQYLTIQIDEAPGERSEEKRKSCRLKDALHSLTNLRHLGFRYNGEAITEGTLGSMREMRSLAMFTPYVESLPDDMRSMSQLRYLTLCCSSLITIPHWVCDFQPLDHLLLTVCNNLEELPGLHKLGKLRKLSIICAQKLNKLPEEFGKKGAFPALESFNLSGTRTLEELPAIEEVAMPLLRKLTLRDCPNLKEFPEGLFDLKNLKEIQVDDGADLGSKMEEQGGEYWGRQK